MMDMIELDMDPVEDWVDQLMGSMISLFEELLRKHAEFLDFLGDRE